MPPRLFPSSFAMGQSTLQPFGLSAGVPMATTLGQPFGAQPFGSPLSSSMGQPFGALGQQPVIINNYYGGNGLGSPMGNGLMGNLNGGLLGGASSLLDVQLNNLGLNQPNMAGLNGGLGGLNNGFNNGFNSGFNAGFGNNGLLNNGFGNNALGANQELQRYQQTIQQQQEQLQQQQQQLQLLQQLNQQPPPKPKNNGLKWLGIAGGGLLLLKLMGGNNSDGKKKGLNLEKMMPFLPALMPVVQTLFSTPGGDAALQTQEETQ